MSIRRDFGLLWCLLGGLLWPALSLSTPAHYRMFEVGEHPAPTVDADVWTRANSVTLEGLGANLPLKAPATMKALYKEGTPDRIYVRWEKTLANQDWLDVATDNTQIASYTAGILYLKMDSLVRALTEHTWILAGSPQPDHYDATWPGGTFSPAANLSHLSVTKSTSGNRQRIQFAFDSPAPLSEGTQFLCGFRDNERITGGLLTYQYAFNVDPTLGHLGLCEAAGTIPAAGATFWIATKEDEEQHSPPCTEAEPCPISRLAATSEPRPSPGETWILKDGKYPIGTHINCKAGSKSGTDDRPITVKAEHERLAWIRANSGSAAFLKISNCAHWNFEGLRIGAISDATTHTGYLFEALASTNIGFRKNLIHHGARHSNNANVIFWKGGGHTVEDNECYYAKRYCFLSKYEHTGGVFRRNAGSFRTYKDLDDLDPLVPSQNAGRNDVFIGIYPSSNWIVEDNYSETNWTGYNSEAGNSQHSDKNRWYGNISLGDLYGIKFAAHASNEMVRDTTVRDFLAVNANPSDIPVSFQSQINAVISHFSLFSTKTSRASVVGSMTNGVNPPNLSMHVTDGIIVGAPGKPAWHISVTGPNPLYDDWRIHHVWRYGNSSANLPATHANIINITTAASSPFGTTRVCVPASLSAIKGKASDGGDPGANVLFRYQDGVKTPKKRWVTTKPASCPANTSGIYPYNMGACVSGLNDTASDSFVGYADRLGMTIDQVETTCGAGTSYFP